MVKKAQMKYRVVIKDLVRYVVDVKADDEDQAQRIALLKLLLDPNKYFAVVEQRTQDAFTDPLNWNPK